MINFTLTLKIKPNEPAPVLNFMHLCDMAFLSQEQKLNIIGMFLNVRSSKFPFVHPKITVVLNFTTTRSLYLKLQIVQKTSGEVIMKMERNLNFEAPENTKADIGLISKFQNISFQEPGAYFLEVWEDKNLIRQELFYLDKV